MVRSLTPASGDDSATPPAALASLASVPAAAVAASPVTYANVLADAEVQVLIEASNANLGVIGYTDHGPRHVTLVARRARAVLRHLGYDERQQELAAIAGLLHDIGNVVSRHDHEHSGALLGREILLRLGMSYAEIAVIMGAIGSHGDSDRHGEAVHAVSAALILADKSDVHRSRVRVTDPAQHDAHDRVNYAAQRSVLRVDAPGRLITLELTIDTSLSPLMSYFEIFLPRMAMCRRAAEFLGCAFHIIINGVSVL